jgi:hypothetical protein
VPSVPTLPDPAGRLLAAQDLRDAAQLISDIGGYADHLSDDIDVVVLRGH